MSVEGASDDFVKMKFPVERTGGRGPRAEWMWAIREDGGYRVNNIPALKTEAFFDDLVSAEFDEDGVLTFKEILERGPYYRCYIHYDSERLNEAGFRELMRELREHHGAKPEGLIRGAIGVAYDEENGPGLFEYLCELLESDIITDFYMDHVEDEDQS